MSKVLIELPVRDVMAIDHGSSELMIVCFQHRGSRRAALEHERTCLRTHIDQSVCPKASEKQTSVASMDTDILKEPHHRKVRS